MLKIVQNVPVLIDVIHVMEASFFKMMELVALFVPEVAMLILEDVYNVQADV